MYAWLTQILTVTALNVRTMPQRLASSTVAAVGIAGVVGVFVAVLSMAEGFRLTLASTGTPETAIVLRGGADTEMTSILTQQDARVIEDAPGIAREQGRTLASGELVVLVDLPKRSTGTPANVPVRGIQSSGYAVRPQLRVTAGRRFEPGRSECMAGKAASGQFSGLDVGSTLTFGQAEWQMVGIFETGGTVAESELWCDANVLAPIYRRGDNIQSVIVRLTSPDAFRSFKDALTTDPRLNLKVVKESEYYAEQSTLIYNVITGLGFLVAGLMGVGAVFGAVNTMYTAVATRTREIATLRALGFGGGPVVISVFAEALLLAVVGGVVGGVLAYVVFNGYQTATINWQSFSQVAFAFRVTPELLVRGVVYAVGMGAIGALLPAVRAARLPVVTALREL
jgi:putative ABC transport system permease protein